ATSEATKSSTVSEAAKSSSATSEATKSSTVSEAAKSSSATSEVTKSDIKIRRMVTAELKPNIGNVTVNANNFLDYFELNGKKNNIVGAWIPTYDSKTGIVTLTEDVQSEVGTITLKNKIDMSSSFSLSAEINLGSKIQPAGADGIGIGFQPGKTNLIGSSGSALGFGKLPGSFGWKADTYWNGKNGSTNSAPDPESLKGSSDSNGYPGDGKGSPFGAFVYCDSDGIVQTINTDTTPAQAISQTGEFSPITINYDGNSKVMTVVFDGKTWSKNMSEYLENNEFESLFISASTGNLSNIQQFKIVSFNYIAGGVVNVQYQDQNGNKIHDDANQITGKVGESYDTSSNIIDIPGYTYIKADGQTSGLFGNDAITVTYIYHQTERKSMTKTTERTINYLDKKTGKVVANQVVQDVTFNRTAIVDKVTGELLGYDTNGDGEV
ncbi:MucBP domain-containing protein, partial [Lactiplantibacillus plantarum]